MADRVRQGLGWAFAIATLVASAPPLASAQTGTAPTPAPTPCTRKFGDPIPRGYPWITADDFPQSALRQELTGTVRFRVNVNALGRVENVEILGVEGAQEYAAATVRVLTRRARFTPAVRNCQPVPGEYEDKIRWVTGE